METLNLTMESDYILTVKLQRPEVRNAINSVMMQDLMNLWKLEIPQRPKLRCIILTGAGDKAFCAGADLKERQNISLEIWQQQHLALQQAMLAQVKCPIPIIAAVNGAAFGGGLELALACDFIYAANTATFAQSEVKLGIMPGAMGTQNLPRACGLRQAKELSFTGTVFSAEQALTFGIVNKVFEPNVLITESLKTAEIIAQNAPFAVRQVKKAIDASLTLEIAQGYRVELQAYQQLLPTKDRIEGIRAFNEKRKPVFTDE
jgi:enoyl-CoA hydratase